MLSNLNLNMLQALGFGLRVQQNGKEFIAVARLNDRLFLAIDPAEQMPANVKLVQADLAVTGGAPELAPQKAVDVPAGAAKKDEGEASQETPPDSHPVAPVS